MLDVSLEKTIQTALKEYFKGSIEEIKETEEEHANFSGFYSVDQSARKLASSIPLSNKITSSMMKNKEIQTQEQPSCFVLENVIEDKEVSIPTSDSKKTPPPESNQEIQISSFKEKLEEQKSKKLEDHFKNEAYEIRKSDTVTLPKKPHLSQTSITIISFNKPSQLGPKKPSLKCQNILNSSQTQFNSKKFKTIACLPSSNSISPFPKETRSEKSFDKDPSEIQSPNQILKQISKVEESNYFLPFDNAIKLVSNNKETEEGKFKKMPSCDKALRENSSFSEFGQTKKKPKSVSKNKENIPSHGLNSKEDQFGMSKLKKFHFTWIEKAKEGLALQDTHLKGMGGIKKIFKPQFSKQNSLLKNV